jgi:hypothetical protein
MLQAQQLVLTCCTYSLVLLIGGQASHAQLLSYGSRGNAQDRVRTGASSKLLSTPTLLRDNRYSHTASPQPSKPESIISQSTTPKDKSSSYRRHRFFSALGGYRPDIGKSDVSQADTGSNQVPSYAHLSNSHRFDSSVGSYIPDAQDDDVDPLSSANRLQRQLRSYSVAESSDENEPVASPGITISNPAGYGGDRGRAFVSASLQRKVRYTGLGLGPFKGVPDGTLGFGVGFGNASKGLGVQASYTVASFGGSRAVGSGGINLKLHTQLPSGWAIAVGGEGIFNFGRLPSSSSTQFNDFENTYYAAVSRIFPIQEDINAPFSRIALTAGLGSGRFRTVEQIDARRSGIGIFGSVALRATPRLSLIGEWTGQDLAVGASWVPLPGLPLVLTPAFRDLAGSNLSGPRFVIGAGGSVGDLISLLGLFR